MQLASAASHLALTCTPLCDMKKPHALHMVPSLHVLTLQAVGGLREAVACLRDALWLPAQYPSLSSQAPLRLRTGLLLCGPSGCGKTHLVQSAVAELEAAGKMRWVR
eukprot:scaffold198620_cov21-Tisochrysis_lutea.AAC.2